MLIGVMPLADCVVGWTFDSCGIAELPRGHDELAEAVPQMTFGTDECTAVHVPGNPFWIFRKG